MKKKERGGQGWVKEEGETMRKRIRRRRGRRRNRKRRRMIRRRRKSMEGKQRMRRGMGQA